MPGVALKEFTLQPGEAVSFYLSSPEDDILSKLFARQWSDVLDMVRVQGAALDLTYLRHWARHLKVEDLLEKTFS